jgi:hypothetical protein
MNRTVSSRMADPVPSERSGMNEPMNAIRAVTVRVSRTPGRRAPCHRRMPRRMKTVATTAKTDVANAIHSWTSTLDADSSPETA